MRSMLHRKDGKNRLLRPDTELPSFFVLAVPHEDALGIRDDVAFFQTVRAVLVKNKTEQRKTTKELDHAIRLIILKAMVSGEVIDILNKSHIVHRFFRL